jgi:hypothetical protein
MSSMDDLQIGVGTPRELTDEGQELATFGHRLDTPVIYPCTNHPGEPGHEKGTACFTEPAAGIDFSNGMRGKYAKTDVQHYDLLTVRPFLKTLNARLTRKRYSETPLRDYLAQIQPTSLAEQYLKFYDAHPFHKEVCAGAKHHHWWAGGLESHLTEMLGIGMDVMDLYPGDFTFTKSDLIISVFLHDFSKIWAYRYITPEDREKNPKKFKDKQVFTYTEGQFNILNDEARILLELGRAGIVPTDSQWSAVLFAEGGFSQAMYDFGGRSTTGNTVFSSNHLATMVSLLDQWSAAILGRSLI